ncbi:MAG TPA: M48 family metallopeptidase [Candidatus Binatia bacterium]|nr:M48 family metallopeptidase [Candidatus Binatia bacterium]
MEQLVVGLFLALFALEFIVEFGLNEVNLAHVRARRSAHHVPDFMAGKIYPADYEKSVQYTMAKGKFARWSEIYGGLVTLGVLFSGILPLLDQSTARLAAIVPQAAYARGILFCFAVGLIYSVTTLPLDLYATFGLEARFGFNNTTWRLYLADKLKGIALGIVIGVPFLWVVLWLMDNFGPHWWLWAFLFIAGFQFLMIILYPVLIAPWFNKFEPLKEGEFRDRILALADKVGFKTSGIFSMDGSKRSGHSNAYFTGIGKAKRIVLFDTLLNQMSIDQGLAVLAHEMGHYKMKHIRRMLVVQLIFLLIGLFVLSLLLNYTPFYTAFGLNPSSHAALVLFSLISGPATFYLSPLMNRLSRRHEYEADHFAVQTLGKSKDMEDALINLTIKNLSNPTPHPWYSAYHYSHPTTEERIRALRA